MDNIQIKLELPNTPISKSIVNVSTIAFLDQLELTFEEVSDVNTALSEAIDNCIFHAYPEMTENIIVTYILSGRELTVIVRDCGFGITDIEQAVTTAYSTAGRRGMGFTIMELNMDDMIVKSIPGRGTTVTMKKKFADR